MEIHVRNMVCGRCIKSVTAIFQKAGIDVREVRLGIVDTVSEPGEQQVAQIKKELVNEGFEWLDDQKVRLVEQIKKLIIELVHYGELDEMRTNLSAYLAERLHKDYHHLAKLFSSIEDTTIEQYFILQKTEKVKEWLVYNEFTLSEIALSLGYSSVAHLSSQFKKITGMTPTQFKNLKQHDRRPLDKV